MTGEQWMQKRAQMADTLAKIMEEQVSLARRVDSGSTVTIAAALANAETCERLIANLCDWQGDDENDVGVSEGPRRTEEPAHG